MKIDWKTFSYFIFLMVVPLSIFIILYYSFLSMYSSLWLLAIVIIYEIIMNYATKGSIKFDKFNQYFFKNINAIGSRNWKIKLIYYIPLILLSTSLFIYFLNINLSVSFYIMVFVTICIIFSLYRFFLQCTKFNFED
ncbi:hypothetical protein MOO46_06620 [Apilactobacillus apisilvae]|uniref:Uncharacterized protein n=1 Tax=Apilactobacillus apisilvae TaxID=2923364 RepID=A0ABY4PHM1_9LACO|nr:hypothetical protein [Apilactobacillus apisilvae]UQS84912.1 hypothetical protein MOO46_06620 [Apilactobacillus apisilvae]